MVDHAGNPICEYCGSAFIIPQRRTEPCPICQLPTAEDIQQEINEKYIPQGAD